MRTHPLVRFPAVGFRHPVPFFCLAPWLLAFTLHATAFEGQINVALTQGSQAAALCYTIGPNHLRIEVTGTNWPNPVDIVEQKSGVLTLVFPHNWSFVRLKSASETASAGMPGIPGAMPAHPDLNSNRPLMPAMPGMPMAVPPGMPPGIGPQPSLPLPNPANPGAMMPAMSSMSRRPMPMMPMMPMMPTMMGPKLELKDTGQATNILGFVCHQYELKERGETLEIWATGSLPPYQPYTRNQPHRFGPSTIEEQWPALLAKRNLFPMFASLRYDSGRERFRFEVTSINRKKITEPDHKLFEPPPGYREVQPLPF